MIDTFVEMILTLTLTKLQTVKLNGKADIGSSVVVVWRRSK